MWIRERITGKVVILIVFIALLSVAAAYLAAQYEPPPEPEPEPVPEPEPISIPEPEPVPEPEPIHEPEPVPEPELIPEPEPEPDPIPEPIEIIPPPIPIPPPEVPDAPEEITNIPQAEIQEKVDRFNAQPGTPIPSKNAISGTVSRVHSGEEMEINGVLLSLRGVNVPTGDGVESDLWRQALMRICPVGSLAIYGGGSTQSSGGISTDVWCYGYPSKPPKASANEVMDEADHTLIGRGCNAPHDTRLLGCTR